MASSERKQVVLSTEFQNDIKAVFEYGNETFSFNAAKTFVSEIYMLVWNLDYQYLMFPEVRFLSSKGKKYRNIILGSYLIIYRIEAERVEVLRIFHSSQCIRRNISSVKKINPIKKLD
jgi:plasmid stabilization system protein ParE